MKTAILPSKIHGLAVLSIAEARAAGFESITTDINAETEAGILAGVARHRDPRRAAFIHVGPNLYELALLKGDIAPTTEAEDDEP